MTEKYKKKIELLAMKLRLSSEYIDNNGRKDEFVKKFRVVLERRNKYGFTLNGPLHYSLFHSQTDNEMLTENKFEHLYRQLDRDLNKIQDYLSGRKTA